MFVNVWRNMPTKWLLERPNGSKNGPGITLEGPCVDCRCRGRGRVGAVAPRLFCVVEVLPPHSPRRAQRRGHPRGRGHPHLVRGAQCHPHHRPHRPQFSSPGEFFCQRGVTRGVPRSVLHSGGAALVVHPFVGEREFVIDNLLVRIHYIIVMIRWTGLAPWNDGERGRRGVGYQDLTLDLLFPGGCQNLRPPAAVP